MIAPDGVSYAYATSDMNSSGTAVNKITVVHPGRAPEVIADRVSDPNHPTSDAPSDPGPTTCSAGPRPASPSPGCRPAAAAAAHFDMQMQSAFSGVINPDSETVTTLTADTTCPLSNVGPGLGDVCFATNTSGGTNAIRIAMGGVTRTYPMSGANVAGNAVFSSTGSAVAYETIPLSENSCGATLTPTLHVMTVVGGSAVAASVGDFTPRAWAPGGAIYGELESRQLGQRLGGRSEPGDLRRDPA